jgi:hypothetical protein
MNVVIANMWRRRRKRWGGDMFFINTNVIRRNLTIQATYQYDARYERAIQIVKPFLMENYQVENIRLAVRKFYQDIGLIQRKIRDQLVVRVAKVEVLKNYWDKMLG